MRIQIDTVDKTVTITSTITNAATKPETLDTWIKALTIARNWLRSQQQGKK